LGRGNWSDFLAAEPVTDCEPLPADHPFLLAYTSGTTGRPKGAVHTHGGFPLKSASEIAYHADQREGELLFWMTDPGWIVGPLTMTGAGMLGHAILLYDGAPDQPSAGKIADLLERHGVAIFGASPTFIRSLMSEKDTGFPADLPKLRVLLSSGEAWNEGPWWWFFERVGQRRCPIVNLAGGTEAGSLLGVLPIRPLQPCSFNSPCVGVDLGILAEDGRPVEERELGELVVRQPWPGQTAGLWEENDAYIERYWSRFPGNWAHGDWASRDDGYLYLHGRSDDTIMIAGKRVGPAEIESALVAHAAVIEAAAIGVPDEIKGESLWCFAVVRDQPEGLEHILRALVGERLGKSFQPKRIVFVNALPKTRSGKIVRRAVKTAVLDLTPGDTTGLEDTGVLEGLRGLAIP
jgi:acetyl-CoA synthetase